MSSTQHPLYWLPNALTILRCFMGCFVAWAIISVAQYEIGLLDVVRTPGLDAGVREYHVASIASHRAFWGALAFMIFGVAAITDWLDGFLARKWKAESAFGRLMDPISDKIVVGLPLIAIAAVSNWSLPITIPAFAIVFRDVSITLLRFAGLGASAMAVQWIAKLKTFLEMIILAVFLLIMALMHSSHPLLGSFLTLWTIALWGVAALSVYTGLGYVIGLIRRPSPSSAVQTEENNGPTPS